jgi:hypothetical protein
MPRGRKLGVAKGEGLLAMEAEAATLEAESGVKIRVYGFDAGSGLPDFIGDHRSELLRQRLSESTTLILGDGRETVPSFFQIHDPPPIGFVAFDLELVTRIST